MSGDREDALARAAAQPVECLLAVRRAVIGDEVGILDRDEHLVALGIDEPETGMRHVAGLDHVDAIEAADAMVGMHDQAARLELPRQHQPLQPPPVTAAGKRIGNADGLGASDVLDGSLGHGMSG